MTTGLRQKPLRGHREAVPAQAAATERAEIHSLLPAEIVDFDPDTQEATVKILHKPKLNGKEVPFPDLVKVPVVFNRGGGAALTWPIGKGDPGNIKIAERNIDAWYNSGEASPADTNRMHDLSDAIFEPGGMRSWPQKIESFNNKRTELRMLAGLPKVEMGDDLLLIKFSDDCYIELTGAGVKIVGPRVDLNP